MEGRGKEGRTQKIIAGADNWALLESSFQPLDKVADAFFEVNNINN